MRINGWDVDTSPLPEHSGGDVEFARVATPEDALAFVREASRFGFVVPDGLHEPGTDEDDMRDRIESVCGDALAWLCEHSDYEWEHCLNSIVATPRAEVLS